MNNRSANKNGAAMLWAVLSVLMISIITAGIVFISRTYYAREKDESLKMQAEFYGQSAIELIAGDIEANNESSRFVSADNSTKVVEAEFSDAANWTCKVAINHSLVNQSEADADPTTAVLNAKKSGEIYLTAKVLRKGKSGKTIELAEVCAKLKYENDKWVFKGYYNL
ncbi:MAG: hypothetical protein ACI4JN_11115 [Ruminococcus sp.]